ncbi:N-acetylmuramoyl-L-alanine amidase [Kitasatospora sp. NPDC057015]|uniref:N-acetylmuramoyl-L-alanine amidase n=1 Tax=Kitasatospora sp. NPDC057015 TaxID=3346001 RepID=UPI00363C2CE2
MPRPAFLPRPAGARARVALVLVLGLLPAAVVVPRAVAEVSGGGGRAAAFAVAAARYGVPPAVLLGVSYLESRWDAHGGAPSRDAGYGPMHLTDARRALAAASRLHPGGGGAAAVGHGEEASPPTVRRTAPAGAPPAGAQTVDEAARLTGLPPELLRSDPAANIAGGAALLAAHQAALGEARTGDPADWYGAVARYGEAVVGVGVGGGIGVGAGSGAGARAGDDLGSAGRQFAEEVFAVIAEGPSRVTDGAGGTVRLPAAKITPRRGGREVRGHQSRASDEEQGPDCPSDLDCEWLPAPYRQLSDQPGDFGNHDLADRPADQPIDYIVVHDTEESWSTTLNLVTDPAYASWHYTIRSGDGHVANHLRVRDIGRHAANWYVNARSVGIEHEGFLATGQWYTEALYRSSAKLVRHLAARYGVPIDRAHIVGHDGVPGPVTASVPTMHSDPGPYWDWAHYFALLGRPFAAEGDAGTAGVVTIAPDFEANTEPYSCEGEGERAGAGADQGGEGEARQLCPVHGSASVTLRTEPRDDAALLTDVGIRPTPGTWAIRDSAARVSTGQQYAVAGRSGDWTAVWYLGQKGWFRNPASAPTALPARAMTVTTRPGRASVPVYGRAYPEAAAYPPEIPVQPLSPLPYELLPGQRYTAGPRVLGEYYYARTFDLASHAVVRGRKAYYQVQFGQRFMFVDAEDVLLESAPPVPAGG